MKVRVWFSCGVASFVAGIYALKKYKSVEFIRNHIYGEHPDNGRIHNEAEKVYKQPIKIILSPYKDHFEVIEKTKWIKGKGARCTQELKIRPRQRLEYEEPADINILGFTVDETVRAERFKERLPDTPVEFPLIEKNLTKENCLCQFKKYGIKQPAMYELGYENNNCIGCIKGGAGYWNKIKKDFPEIFDRMAKLEREIGFSILRNNDVEKDYKLFLDELPELKGKPPKPIVAQCSIFCGQI